MKVKNFLLTFFSFAALTLNATDNVDSSPLEVTYPTRADQKIDTKDWVQFPVTIAVNQDIVETIQILFPVQPEFINPPLSEEPLIVAKDSEGMTYSLARTIIPNEQFNIEDTVDFITDAIKGSYKNKLIWTGKMEHNPNFSSGLESYILAWVNDENRFTQVVIVKSQYVVYVLETSVTDDIYQDIETMVVGNQVFEKFKHNSLKNGVFINSFRITSEMKTNL